ncbi:MAG: hypothetical protein ACT6FF_09605 [Methanosarcinaceae archaeon]
MSTNIKTEVQETDIFIDACTREYLKESGNVYIKLEAKLYERANGSRYIVAAWYVHGCQRLAGEYSFPAPCEMTVTTWVSEPINLPEIVHEFNSCTASNTDVIDVPSSGDYTINVKLETKCYAYVVPGIGKFLTGFDDGSCNCSITG